MLWNVHAHNSSNSNSNSNKKNNNYNYDPGQVHVGTRGNGGNHKKLFFFILTGRVYNGPNFTLLVPPTDRKVVQRYILQSLQKISTVPSFFFSLDARVSDVGRDG